MFSRQFCEIFKSTFFLEHVRWLLLPILKSPDSQRQLCKRISKLVTIYFISKFLVLVGIFVFILASTSFLSTSRRPCGWRNMTFLIFHVTTQLKCHVIFWVGPPHPDSAPYQVLGAKVLVNVEIKRFWLDTWPRDPCVTWLCKWGSLIVSHYPAKFGVHRVCESGNITFFVCHVTMLLKFHINCGWGCLTLSHHHAKLGFHRPCKSGDVTFLICHMTTRSMCHVTM